MVEAVFGLYLVLTEPVRGHEAVTEAAVKREVRLVQLRMKRRPQDEVLATARRLRSIVRGSATRLIVNDDPLVAREAGADGLHVGQDDLPVAEARRRLPGKIIGLSTHGPGQVRRANGARPDYLGVGPVYPTPTKAVPDPVLGLSRMAAMIHLAAVPAVAIGGIDASNLRAVLRAGARNFAVVRAVCGAADPGAAIDALQAIWRDEEARRGSAPA